MVFLSFFKIKHLHGFLGRKKNPRSVIYRVTTMVLIYIQIKIRLSSVNICLFVLSHFVPLSHLDYENVHIYSYYWEKFAVVHWNAFCCFAVCILRNAALIILSNCKVPNRVKVIVFHGYMIGSCCWGFSLCTVHTFPFDIALTYLH